MKSITRSTIVLGVLVLMGWMLGAKAGFSAPMFETKITASDGAKNDMFGQSVSISDGQAIVGAFKDDDKGDKSGSAYIFEWNGSAWIEEEKLTASDGAEEDNFGFSVSISGTRAIVGAPQDSALGNWSGSAYIFEKKIGINGLKWTKTAKLTASDGAQGDLFGRAVSISDSRAIVGAITDDDKGGNSGSVYIFEWNGSAWVEEIKLTASDGSTGKNFGIAVSISGGRAVVGAHFDDENGIESGSIYIFERKIGPIGLRWVETAKFAAPGDAAGNHFGQAVSISGWQVIAGAPMDNDNGVQSGSAYIFEFDGSTWAKTGTLRASDGANNDQFGYSVSISSDRAVVGAHRNDAVAENAAGAVYIFERYMSSWIQTEKLVSSDIEPFDAFGESVSISGDRVFVGSPHNNGAATISGSAYIYEVAIPLVEYSFDDDAEGWTFIGSFPGFDQPLNTDQDGHLGMSPNGSIISYGFWVSPQITVEAGKSYRARAIVSSTAADPNETLTFRLRANQTVNQRGWVQVMTSSNGEAPSAGNDKTYELLINPLIESGTDTIVLSFDMLSFDPFEDLGSWVYLENITFDEIP